MRDWVKAMWAIAFVTIGFLMGTYSCDAKASSKLAPPWGCTMNNRMDIFVDEDDILWECLCEALKSGHICHWQVVGGVEAVNSRKFRKAHPRIFKLKVRPGLRPILVRV